MKTIGAGPNPGLDWMCDNCRTCTIEGTCSLQSSVMNFLSGVSQLRGEDKKAIGFQGENFPLSCQMKQVQTNGTIST